MKKITCIVCPNGCKIKVEKESGNYKIRGFLCKKGYDFAIREYENPTRTLCTTVRTTFKELPRLSVKTDGEISKRYIFDLMKKIDAVVVDKPLGIGAILLKNVFDTNVNVIATADMQQQLQYLKRE